MPATESTWRSLKLMHVVFGVASVGMLICTVWMLAADHNRQWKDYERKYHDIETWTNASRILEQDSSDYGLTQQKLEQDLAAVQEAALSDEGQKLFEQFVENAKNPGKADSDAEKIADSQAADLIAADAKTLAGYTNAKQRSDLRMDLFNRLNDFVGRVKFREDELTGALKFRKAALDKAMASYSIAVGNGASADEIGRLQLDIDTVREDVSGLTMQQQLVQTHRKDLEAIVRDITAENEKAKKALNDHKQQLAQLRKAYDNREPTVWRKALEMPVLDAFNSPLKIDPIWLPDLTLNNNFKEVARFDHCTTCHQSMEKTAPGSATAPAYEQLHTVTISLATPEKAPETKKDEKGAETPPSVSTVYGFQLTEGGPINRNDVALTSVFPKTPAADAGLMAGDIIERVGDTQVFDLDHTLRALLVNPKWGQPVALTVKRGMPHPYSSHPRLDLFVGSSSPHPKDKFGCTICHQGQGSATSFEWASHTPSSPQQADEWAHQYGWAYNHHWIFPMLPTQFQEASCLKCHHEVVDLEPSAKYPDPPAPTLVKGYEIVRNYGCFGCHEINGYNGPTKRVGPDVRAEPSFFAAAAQIKADSGFASLPSDVKGWVDQLIATPLDDAPRNRLREFLLADAQAKTPQLSQATDKLESALKDVEVAGLFRKVGPSLRYVGSKDGYDFLYSWIRNPRDFRPSTKMPRFFGLWDHLVPEEKLDENGQPVVDKNGNPEYEQSKGLTDAQKYEPIEVRAIANYLLTNSEKFEYLGPASSGNVLGSVERGKKAFEMRCIACHQHADFPQALATQGPNLSRVGAKLSLKPYGAQWLYSWIKNPSHYHARTVMPNTLLTPVKAADGTMTDPIADITAFLMQSTESWKPNGIPAEHELSEAEHEALNELALLYVREKFPPERAEEFVKHGIPASRAAGVKGDEAMLLQQGAADQSDAAKAKQTECLLLYVGRRTISKYGCSGCHDIPGYEDSKPIGTSLADWGRKDPSRLAFEQVAEYITHHAWPAGDKAAGKNPEAEGKESGATASAAPHAGHEMSAHAGGHGNAMQGNLETALFDLGPTQGWLMEKLLGHEREGFIWQKLRAPRSYDFKKTENKSYNDRLRMPQFPFKEDEIEAVMTFVLGLVSEPPAPQYVATYNNNPREKAVIAGTRMVEQFNCTGCHQLDFDRWDVAYKPGELGKPAEAKDYSFELPHFTPKEIEDSKKLDRQGLLHAQLYGAPLLDAKGKPVTQEDDDAGDAVAGGIGTRFVLWHDQILDGKEWLVGVHKPLVPNSRVTEKHPGRGGDLGRWIYPAVVADELAVNPNAKADEAWGWLPPPLIGEGKKVQTRWLHDFLLDPTMIRPAVVLRMPKFNMSSAESSMLVNFFAARDDAPAPYEFDSRTSSDYLASAELKHNHRLFDALKIVTNNNYCVQCHMVGDFVPQKAERAMAPQLDRVTERLRPDYVERWVGNPKRILPYTGMPVNIPFDKPIDQKLYAGDSLEQLNGLVDLLMNWDRFTKSQFTVAPYIQPAGGAPAGGTPPPGTGASSGTPDRSASTTN